MKTFLHKHRHPLLLTLIILIQLLYITYIFCQREGWHIDEAWSYGFANADHQVGINFNKDNEIINYGKWLDSSIFKEYIEVQDGKAFQFGTAYYNCTVNHNNPPLYNLILHAVCSFFPNTFSWWYSYFINVISFVIAMIALFALARELTHSRNAALLTCVFYGFTTAALNTFIYLRMYAFLTTLVILLCYIHARLYNKHFQKNTLSFIYLFLVTVLGGSTQYIFLFLAFCITAVFSCYLLLNKKWKTLLCYCGVMALSAATVFLLWPYDIEKFTTPSLYGAEMPYLWEIKYCLQCIFNQTLGIWIPYLNPLRNAIILIAFVYVLILVTGICFIFRKSSRFKNLISQMRTSIAAWLKLIPKKLYNMNKLYLLFSFTWIGTMLIIAKTCNIFVMGKYADRYLFCLFPIVSVLFVGIVYKCIQRIPLKRFKTNKKIPWISVTSLLIVLIIVNHIHYPCNYLFQRQCDAPPISELVKDSNVILLTKSSGNLPFYPPMFLDSRHFFVSSPFEDIDTTIEAMDKLDDNNSAVYLIAEAAYFLPENYQRDETKPDYIYDEESMFACPYKLSEYLDKVTTCKWSTQKKYIQTEDSFKGTLVVYKLR
ncbi:MAG: glycosyltransferase family 39 protein [Eubacterium sp.]|nr:glycosyltransferase family 39 protein [Eubacterium sp.]